MCPNRDHCLNYISLVSYNVDYFIEKKFYIKEKVINESFNFQNNTPMIGSY